MQGSRESMSYVLTWALSCHFCDAHRNRRKFWVSILMTFKSHEKQSTKETKKIKIAGELYRPNTDEYITKSVR